MAGKSISRSGPAQKKKVPGKGNKQTVKLKRDFMLQTAIRFKRRSLTTGRVTDENTPSAINSAKPRFSIDQIFIQKKRPHTRLPKAFYPTHYDIEISPHLDLFTFQGSVIICMEVKEPASTIVLNSVGLFIDSCHFFGDVQEAMESKDAKIKLPDALPFEATDATETLIIKMSRTVSKGACALKIFFKGVITDQMKGLHYSRYLDKKQEVCYNFLTKCEPCDARRVFPCFDEPEFKAKFTLTLIIPKAKIALANTLEKNVRKKPNDVYKSVIFEQTQIMSTSVFSFVIGEFVYMQEHIDGVRIRVYTPAKLKGQGKFALTIAKKAIEFMGAYTSKRYSQPKLDFVAVQEMNIDVQSNWGLIICREDAILIRDTKFALETPKVVYQRVALLVSHAVALQWFGNLVSMLWWSDVWLNVGLATFLQYCILEDKFKSFYVMSQFPNDVMENAMREDMFESAHALTINLENPPEVEEAFDEINYAKGATIVRMVHEFVGGNIFQQALSTYLTSHDFGSVISRDLWSAIGRTNSQNMNELMVTWTRRSGYPLVSVSKAITDGALVRLRLKQQRFQPDTDNLLPDNDIWAIPFNLVSTRDPTKVFYQGILKQKEMEISFEAKDEECFLLNNGFIGYFRVKYSHSQLTPLIDGIKSQTIQAANRLEILRDNYAMAISGYQSVVDVLQLLPTYTMDTDYNVWRTIDDIVHDLDILISYSDPEVYARFVQFVLELYRNVETNYGREAFERKNPPIHEFTRFFRRIFKCLVPSRDVSRQDHLECLSFALVIRRLCLFGHSETVSWAKNWFVAATNDESDLHPDLYGALSFGFVRWKANEVNLHLIFRAYRKADTLESKELVIDGFGLFNTQALIRKILQFGISNHVPLPHTPLIMVRCAMTKLGRHITWYFFKEHHPHFSREFYQNEQLLKPFFRYVLSYFVTEKRYQDVKAFFDDHPFQGLKMTVEQTLHHIRRNISWAKRDFANVSNYFMEMEEGESSKRDENEKSRFP